MANNTYTQKFVLAGEDRTKQALTSLRGNLGQVDKALGGLKGGLIGALGAGGALALGIREINQAAKELDGLAKRARSLGMASEDLDSWEYAAQLSGVAAEDMAKGLKTLTKSIYDTSQGTGLAKAAFADLGIKVTDNTGRMRDLSSVIFDIAGAFEKDSDQVKKAAMAQQIFGRSGLGLVNMLDQGKEGIQGMIVEAHALGSRYDELTVRGENYEDAQLRLNRALRTTKDAVIGSALPALSALAEMMASKVVTAVTGLDADYREFLGTLSIVPHEMALTMIADKEKELRAELEKGKIKLEESTAALVEYSQSMAAAKTGGMGLQYQSAVEDAGNLKGLERQLEALAVEKERVQHRLDLLTEAQKRWNTAAGEGSRTAKQQAADEAAAAKITDRHKDAATKYSEAVEQLDRLHSSGLISAAAYRAELNALSAAITKLDPAYQRNIDLEKEAAAQLDKLIDPQRDYNHEMERLGVLLAENLLSWEEYLKLGVLAEKERDQALLALRDLATGAEDTIDAVGIAGSATARGVGALVTDLVTQSKGELRDLAEYATDIANQIISSLIQAGLVDPLVRAVTKRGGSSTAATGGDFIGPPAPLDKAYQPATGPALPPATPTPPGLVPAGQDRAYPSVRTDGRAAASYEAPADLGRAYPPARAAAPVAAGYGAHAGASINPPAAGDNITINWTIQALDTAGAVEVLTKNRGAIVGMVQQEFNRRGKRGPMG